MAACFASGVTCWHRRCDWTRAGVWGRTWKVVLAELAASGLLDTSEPFLDAIYGDARKGWRASAEPAEASA